MATRKEVNEYNRMIKAINEYKRKLLKRRREEEKKRKGGFGLPSLPDLVVPKRRRRITTKNYKRIRRLNLQEEIKRLKRDFDASGNPRRFKQNYLEVLLNMIVSIDPSVYLDVRPFNNPSLKPYLFSQNMQDQNPDLAPFLKLYNKFALMSNGQFNELYEKGYIVELRFIYIGMEGEIKDYDPLDEQRALLRDWRRLASRKMERKEITSKRTYGKSKIRKGK